MILRLEGRAGFLNLDTITFWDRYFFVLGGCPVHCKKFSSIPDLHPLDSSSDNQVSPDIANCPLGVGEWGKIAAGWEPLR